MCNKPTARRFSLLLGAVALFALSAARADTVILSWSCDSCTVLPQPTTVVFDPATQLFQSFEVNWNEIAFDFTFPNLQPTYVRQWFWDALNGLPVGETAHPGLPKQIFTVYWDGDTYTQETNACLRFRIGASGAGPRCVLPPHPTTTLVPVHETGTVATVSTRLAELLIGASSAGPGQSLVRNVELAQVYYAVPDIQATCAVLDDFVSQVDKFSTQKKPKISTELATKLSSEAYAIKTAIPCP